MRISVIVPLFNARPYIAEAIDSILAQSRAADEVLIVDDGSTDGSRDVVMAYGSPVRLLTQDHAGPATALNLALRQAAGELIAFLDADDLWLAPKLERQEAALLADDGLDGVLAHVQQFTGLPDGMTPPQAGVGRITLLARRSVFDRFGLFDSTLRTADFVPWYARATTLGMKTLMMPEVLAYRRLHETNTGILRRDEQQRESLLGLKQALDLRRREASRNRPQKSD